MKSNFCLTLIPVLLALFVMSGCQGANDPVHNTIIIPGPEPSQDLAIPYNLHPLRTPIPRTFMRGADISNCYEVEEHGGAYRNFDGEAEDIVNILAENGINTVRIRLWLDPDKNPQHYAGDGDNTTAVGKAIAVRAKSAGLGVMLDFQYSDWWANPSTQQIPYAWKDIPTKQGLLDALYAYTKETIEEFTAAGAAPDAVKIGNEITDGLLSQHAGGSDGGTGYMLNGWGDYSGALAAAAQAVRDSAPRAKIVIHFGDGGNGYLLNVYSNFTRRSNGQPPLFTEVDYDVMGLSWYPIWANHLSIDSLYSNIKNLKETFGKDVMVCETGYMWTMNNFDSFSNYVGEGNEEIAFNMLTNINGFTSDSGLEFAYRANGTTQYLPSTPENQARVARVVMDAVSAAGGIGVVWWGADWIALPLGSGLRSNAEMGALFESTGYAATNGKALPALRVLGSLKAADTAKPGAVTGLGAAVAGDTVTLNYTAVNSAIASCYQLDRAQSTDGPWTTVSDTLTGSSYTDTGLDENTAYYYRARAYNSNGWGPYCDPIEAETLAFAYGTPSGLRVTDSAADSVSLEWNPVAGAASYILYGVKKSAPPPADSAYAPVAEIDSGTAYTHSGLKSGDTWWYKVSAVYVNHGEGPRSAAVSATVGTPLDLSATINMANSVLDADFRDSLKASSSADCSTIMKTDGSNYQIAGIYAANDSAYLYIALDYGKLPAMWQNDWITVWIDNTNSTAGGATTNTGNYRIAQNQTITPPASIEFSLSHYQNTVTPSTVTKNTVWTNVGNNLWEPGAADFVIKYRIPLSGIGGAVKGNVLKILVSNTQGWNSGSQPVAGCVVPMAAVTGAFADNDTVSINMEQALSYTVK